MHIMAYLWINEMFRWLFPHSTISQLFFFRLSCSHNHTTTGRIIYTNMWMKGRKMEITTFFLKLASTHEFPIDFRFIRNIMFVLFLFSQLVRWLLLLGEKRNKWKAHLARVIDMKKFFNNHKLQTLLPQLLYICGRNLREAICKWEETRTREMVTVRSGDTSRKKMKVNFSFR